MQLTLLESRFAYGDGCFWHIREMSADDAPGMLMDAHCLIFDCASVQGSAVTRRYWTFPAEWMKLSDVALLALMDATRVIPVV